MNTCVCPRCHSGFMRQRRDPHIFYCKNCKTLFYLVEIEQTDPSLQLPVYTETQKAEIVKQARGEP